jgi:hypothetical protein
LILMSFKASATFMKYLRFGELRAPTDVRAAKKGADPRLAVM